MIKTETVYLIKRDSTKGTKYWVQRGFPEELDRGTWSPTIHEASLVSSYERAHSMLKCAAHWSAGDNVFLFPVECKFKVQDFPLAFKNGSSVRPHDLPK